MRVPVSDRGAMNERPLPAALPASALVLALSLFAAHPGAAAGQDRVLLVTGVELDGELKEARRGKLSLDNEELDVVSIDLVDIAELTSESFFEVTGAGGAVYRGSLAAGDSGTVVIVGDGASATMNIVDVVEILRFESTFWGRTYGHLDVGANVAAANSLASYLVGGRFGYRGVRWGTVHDLDAYWQRQATGGPSGGKKATRRISWTSQVSRYFDRWAIRGAGSWERNDELELRSRIQFGLLGVRSLVQNQVAYLSAGLGAVNNSEDYADGSPTTTAEAVLAVELDVFDFGDVDLYTAIRGYANLDDLGRYRSRIDARVSWEVINDFTIGVTALEQLDNRPPSASARKRDYQYGLTVGWTWS